MFPLHNNISMGRWGKRALSFHTSLLLFSVSLVPQSLANWCTFSQPWPSYSYASEGKSTSTVQFRVAFTSVVLRQGVRGCRQTEKLHALVGQGGKGNGSSPYWPLVTKRCGYMRIRGGMSICSCVRLYTLSNGGISAVLRTAYIEFQRCLYVFFLVYIAVFQRVFKLCSQCSSRESS